MAACFSAIKGYVTLCGFQIFLFIAVQSAGLCVNNSQQPVGTSRTEDHGLKLFFWRRGKAVFFFFLRKFLSQVSRIQISFSLVGNDIL